MRSGAAAAARVETGRRSRTSGRDSRTNGRMLLRSCGVASLANGRTASLAGASARAAGRSFSVVGPSSSANVSTRLSVSVVCDSVLGSSCTAEETLACSLANESKTADEELTSRARSSSCLASSVERTLSELTRWRSCLRRVGDLRR